MDLYRDHATSEQFHSNVQDRLGSGTDAFGQARHEQPGHGRWRLRLQRAALDRAYRLGSFGGSPVLHPAKRRRIRTVMQQQIALPARFFRKARQFWLGFGAYPRGSRPFRTPADDCKPAAAVSLAPTHALPAADPIRSAACGLHSLGGQTLDLATPPPTAHCASRLSRPRDLAGRCSRTAHYPRSCGALAKG